MEVQDMYNGQYSYPTAYQSAFQNQYLPNNLYSAPQPQKYDVVRVNGRNGAEAFQMAPNSSVLLLDESAPIVWLKTTDGAGYPTVTSYSITPYQPEPQVDTKSLEARIERLERMIDEPDTTEPDRTEDRSSASAGKTANADGQKRRKPTSNDDTDA